MAESCERPNGGVARRRRERRMRSWFRHEQQSIRMALATVLHHSYGRVHTEYGALRSQNTATRVRAEERETNTAPRRPLTTKACRVRGLTVSLTSGRRRGCCGTPWSRWLTARWLCRCLKLQCNRLGAAWLGARSAVGSRSHHMLGYSQCSSKLRGVAETRLGWLMPGIARRCR